MTIERQDPRLQPTPDYGTLGPGSDIANAGAAPAGKPVVPQGTSRRFAVFAAVAGALAGALFISASRDHALWDRIGDLISSALHSSPSGGSPVQDMEHLDGASAQKQAEFLLERHISRDAAAGVQIASRVDGWRGHIRLSPRLNSLVTAGMNSDELDVRAAAIEVDLAAMNVAKTTEDFNRYAAEADVADQSRRVWGLWIVGLLGNRGVQSDRAAELLAAHLHDPNVEVRHWAVEALGYLGSDRTIEPLLQAMHDDPSQMVRERAACSLAQSGMLTREQRGTAVPRLIDYSEDPSLDSATRAFAFHALRDITGQGLPDDPQAWRNWYSSAR